MISAVGLLLLLLVGTNAHEDMGKKVFLFPKETASAHVVLKADLKKPLQQATVCLRSYTDLTRTHNLFSLAVPGIDNAFVMFVMSPTRWQMLVNNEVYDITSDPNTLNWRHSCMTWDSTSGVGQLWVNGKVYPRKAGKKGGTIGTEAIIVLGQDQDFYGGGFETKQSFVGEMSDVHMWDHVLTLEEIQGVMHGFHQGNIINWNALNYEIKGEVLVEPKLRLYGTS